MRAAAHVLSDERHSRGAEHAARMIHLLQLRITTLNACRACHRPHALAGRAVGHTPGRKIAEVRKINIKIDTRLIETS